MWHGGVLVLLVLVLLPPHALSFSGGSGIRLNVAGILRHARRAFVVRCASAGGRSGKFSVFECPGDQRLVNCIRKEFAEGGGAAEAGVEELVRLGAVYVRKCKENKKGRVLLPWSRRIEDGQVRKGSLIRVHTDPARFPADRIDWSRRLLFEDDHYVIVDKPAGIPFQATHDNFRECVVQVNHQSSQNFESHFR